MDSEIKDIIIGWIVEQEAILMRQEKTHWRLVKDKDSTKLSITYAKSQVQRTFGKIKAYQNVLGLVAQ